MAGINGVGRFGVRNYVAPSIATTLWNGLTNYYSGDSTANDSKGSSNATLTNGATYSIGKINNGFSFDGINDALVLTPNPLIGGIATDSYKSFSISCWIKPKYNYYNDQGIFITQLGDDGYRLLLLGDGRLFYRGFYSNGSFGADDIYTSYCIVIGNSYHIAVIHEDGVGTKIYCNDILVGSSSSTGKQYYRSTAGFRIGGDPISGYMGNFNGSIDEFGLWNRAISLSEKTELYNGGAGKQYVAPVVSLITTGLVMNLDASNAASYPGTGTTWTDLSGNVNNGTLINGTSYSLANGGTMVFDGINDQALINNSNSINITTSLTIEGWIKPTSIAGWIAIFYKNTNSVNGGYHLGIDPSGYLAGGLKETSWTTVQSTTNQIQTNTWQQIAMSLDLNNKVLKLYKNGILIKTQTSFNYTLTGNTSPLSIGAQSNGGETFLGSIPICRLYNAVLTDADITSNFNATKTRFGL